MATGTNSSSRVERGSMRPRTRLLVLSLLSTVREEKRYSGGGAASLVVPGGGIDDNLSDTQNLGN